MRKSDDMGSADTMKQIAWGCDVGSWSCIGQELLQRFALFVIVQHQTTSRSGSVHATDLCLCRIYRLTKGADTMRRERRVEMLLSCLSLEKTMEFDEHSG